MPTTTGNTAASEAATPQGGRNRRLPATGKEQERRKAWGETWGAIGKAAGVNARKGT